MTQGVFGVSKSLHPEMPVKGRDYLSVIASDEQLTEMLAFMVFRKIKRVLAERERNKILPEAGEGIRKEERAQ